MSSVTYEAANTVNQDLFNKNIQFLVFQRNSLLAFATLLAITTLILSCFLFLKKERIIITPIHIEKEFWIEGNEVSPSYLEQYGRFISQLLLQKSAHSAASQRAVLLRNTDPSFVGALKGRLIEEEEQLKKQNCAYVFFPSEITVDPENMQVHLLGDRTCYVAGKQISQNHEGYTLSFKFNGFRLLLAGVSLKEIK